MPNNRNRKSVRRGQRSEEYQRLKEDGPPPLQTGTIVRSTYRYRAAATPSRMITWSELILACGTVAGSSGTGVTTHAIARAVRIRRLRAWAAAPIDATSAPSILNIASVSVDFDVTGTQQYQSALQFTDSTASNAKLAFIDVVPPRGSDAALWHNVSGAGSDAFQLTVASSAFIDVELEWVLADATIALNRTSTLAVVAGQMYYPPLDSSSGTPSFIPIGRTQG